MQFSFLFISDYFLSLEGKTLDSSYRGGVVCIAGEVIMKRKITGALLAVFLIISAVSCRNYVYIPYPVVDGSGDEVNPETAYQQTFSKVSWGNVVKQAIAQAGEGMVNGMSSTLTEAGSASQMIMRAATPLSTTTANLILSIAFEGYVDEVSGVIISTGSVSFSMNAEKENTDSQTRYKTEGYMMTSSGLTLESGGVTAEVAVAGMTDSKASMTVTVSESVAAGEPISSAVATNVSLSISMATGSVTVNGEVYDVEEIAPDMPSEPDATIGSEERPFEICSDDDMKELAALLAESTDAVHASLLADIVVTLPSSDEAFFTVKEGQELILSLNGHAIEPEGDNSTTKLYLIADYGKLTINGDGGRLGGHWKTNSIPRGIAIYDGAEAKLYNLRLFTFSTAGGSSLFVPAGGTLSIDDVTINSTQYTIGTAEGSSATISNSRLVNITSNSLSTGWPYAVSSSGNTTIGGTEVYGVQGGIAIIAGTAELNDDIYSETTVDIFSKVEEDFREDYAGFFAEYNTKGNTEPLATECHYGLYITGERNISDSPKCTVNGGEYVSGYRNALQVGNSSDGGEGATAYATIKGGTFWSRNTSSAVVNADDNPQYGHGVLSIEGGRFGSGTNLNLYVDADSYEISGPDGDGFYMVSPKA